MPIKTDFPMLPFLDPALDPLHPIHHVPEIEEDPYLPLSKRDRQQLEREMLDKALAEYTPPHVPRSWETDPKRATVHRQIMALELYPSLIPGSLNEELIPPRGKDGTYAPKTGAKTRFSEDSKDFRQFASTKLHLGYNRFHASHGDPRWESNEDPGIPPGDICWLMEYSLRECNTIRRQIAHALGLFPAVTDITNPFYDEEMAYKYERRLLARCCRRNTRCIRPSHIEIFTSNKMVLP